MIRVNHYETMSKSVKRHAKNTVDFFSDADYSNDYTNGRQLHKDVNSTEALEAIHSQYHTSPILNKVQCINKYNVPPMMA